VRILFSSVSPPTVQLLALFAAAPSLAAQQPDVRAELSLDGVSTELYVGQRVELRLVVTLDRAFRAERLVQLFSRPLELPLEVDAPWLREQPKGLRIELLAADPDSPSAQLAVAGRQLRAARDLESERQRAASGVALEFFVIRIAVTAEQEGSFALSPLRVRYAHATRFREDFIQGRVPEDRREDSVETSALSLRVSALPSEGRPRAFGGAIGRFALSADVEPRQAKVGDSLRLRLRVEGRGNLTDFKAPRLRQLEAFHVLGRVEEREAGARILVYELEALAPLREFPSLELPYFDPEKKSYALARSPALPLRVEGPQSEASAAPRSLPPISLRDPHGGHEAPRESSKLLMLLAVFFPWLLAAALFAWERARIARRLDPELERVHEALSALLAFGTQDDGDLVQLWSEYLGARLRVPAAAVISPDLRARLEAAGVGPELATRTHELLNGLVAARYRRSPSAEFVAEERDLVGELEHAFQALEGHGRELTP
jgi:hypothetical protein